MQKGNLITMQIPPAVKAKALKQIKDLDTTLSPYYSKIPSGAIDFPIINHERVPFAIDGMKFVGTDAKYLPPDADVPELKHDYNVFNDSDELLTPMRQIILGMQATNNYAGSDVFTTLLEYYYIVQRSAAKGDARAKVIYAQMSKLFIKGARASKKATAAANTAAK